MRLLLFLATSALLLHACGDRSVPTAPAVEANVVYGRVANAALLMDVLRPPKANGLGIIAIPGSAWGVNYPKDYDHPSLKEDHELDTAYCTKWTHGLADRGYTVFVIDHRFAPEHQAPEILADVRQAVRYVRVHASEFGIDPHHIAAIGHSSGGNLVSMLGTMDATLIGDTGSIPARVQAVVTLAGLFDLDSIANDIAPREHDRMEHRISSYLGSAPGDSTRAATAHRASPLWQVSADDAPHLIHYSTDDPIIPVDQAVRMHAALGQFGVSSQLVPSDQRGHQPAVDLDQVDRWLQEHLK